MNDHEKKKKLQRSAQKRLSAAELLSQQSAPKQEGNFSLVPLSNSNDQKPRATPDSTNNKGKSAPSTSSKNPATKHAEPNSSVKSSSASKASSHDAAAEKFRICMAEILQKYNYVTANQVIDLYRRKYDVTEQSDLQFINNLHEVRYLKDINIEINASVDAYYYTAPIKLVFECEKFVLKQVNSWLKNVKKQSPAESFEDLGVGENSMIRNLD